MIILRNGVLISFLFVFSAKFLIHIITKINPKFRYFTSFISLIRSILYIRQKSRNIKDKKGVGDLLFLIVK